MRLSLLATAVALSLAACGKSAETEERNAGPTMTAEAISSNDVTAIDAVTGEAANMAADVAITAELINGANAAEPASNSAASSKLAPPARRKTTTTAPANAAEPAAQPESNSQ